MSSKEYFVSQCVAGSPCTNNCNSVDGQCTICKRTDEEKKEWFQLDAEERREICEQLLDR